jgi:hypothetical protein
VLDCNADYRQIRSGGTGVCVNKSSGNCYQYSSGDVQYARGPVACLSSDGSSPSGEPSSLLDCNRDYTTIRAGSSGTCINRSSGRCYRYGSGDVMYAAGAVRCP